MGCCCCSMVKSYLILCDPMDCSVPGSLILHCLPKTNSCLLSWWCYLIISSSAAPFFCLQSFPASESFPTNRLFTSGRQSIGTSASASILPMNSLGWFPESTENFDWFDLLAVQGTQVFSAGQSESINSLALKLLYGPTLISIRMCQQSNVSAF